jgi:hypothetical protein
VSGYGFTCFGCRTQLNFDDLHCSRDLRIVPIWASHYIRVSDEAERRAGLAGWGIGHWDGQGNIVCPECASCVWDFHRFIRFGCHSHVPMEVVPSYDGPVLQLGRRHAHMTIAEYECTAALWAAISAHDLGELRTRLRSKGVEL